MMGLTHPGLAGVGVAMTLASGASATVTGLQVEYNGLGGLDLYPRPASAHTNS